MIISHKFQSKVFIDPIIKQDDKDFFYLIESKLLEAGFLITSLKEEINLNSFSPSIVFLTKRTSSDSFWDDEKFIKIQIKDNNLSLFGDENLKNDDVYLISSEEDLEQSISFLHYYLNNFFEELRESLAPHFEKEFKSLFTKKKIDQLESQCDLEKLQEFEKELYKQPRLKNFLVEFPQMVKRIWNFNIEILTIEQVANDLEERSLLPLSIGGVEYYFVWEGSIPSEFVIGIYSIVYSYTLRVESLIENDLLRADLESILSMIPLPFVLLNEGEISLYNKAFIDLNLSLKDCLELENNNQVTLNHKVFRTLRTSIKGQKEMIIFVSVNKMLASDETPTSQELGIVSSSIAHELNNPLAGILAALDVLFLDDLTEEVSEKLTEMKKGVMRCKKLVETYLGFSRIQRNPVGQMRAQDSDYFLKDSLAQSLELMRFRLIENNLTLLPQHEVKSLMEGNLNPHVLSMLLYLIFGEAVTNFSHHSLVTQENKKQLSVDLREEANKFSLSFPKEAYVSDKFFESKLISHLVDRLNLTLNFDQSKIEFVLNF